ncbi:MAG: hypothetical protein K1X57_04210 [Gemmataceae bacterium]|nr:hypothetical protein [Gemmataceae bacterium]
MTVLEAEAPRPESSSGRSNKLIAILAGIAFLAVTGGVGSYAYLNRVRTQRNDLIVHKIRREPLALTVVERGTLESADNRDVVCRVKAGTKASNLTIKWVIDDGTLVKHGQLLVEIDDSALQDQLKAQKITLDTARANRVQAEENYKIVVSQTESDIESARVAVELAMIDLKKYEEGDYQQARKDVENKILLARSDVEQQRERVAYTERMAKMKYLSLAQLQSEQSKYQGYEVQLLKVLEEQRVLEDYTKGRTLLDMKNKVEEAKRALDRQKKQATAKLAQAEAERLTKRSIYDQEEDKYEDIVEQINNCRIYAPQDGLVVYYVSEQSRWGSGSSQSIVAVGEPVKEGQRLMRIPDLRRMLVNTKVHEAMVSRVRGEVWQHTGFTDTVRASLLCMTDPINRVTAMHALSDLKDRFHELDHRKTQEGQRATVRIDAFPDRVLGGHVRSVATVASQQDWMSADVKVYQTLVGIDESVDGLKPGMSAEVTIQIEGSAEDVLALPLQAIVGGAELGPYRKCFVRTPEGPKEREIVVGLANDKMAEIRSGLEEGDEVILNPKVLLGEKAKVRTAGDDRPSAPGEDGGKKKGKGKPAGIKAGGPNMANVPSK